MSKSTPMGMAVLYGTPEMMRGWRSNKEPEEEPKFTPPTQETQTVHSIWQLAPDSCPECKAPIFVRLPPPGSEELPEVKFNCRPSCPMQKEQTQEETTNEHSG